MIDTEWCEPENRYNLVLCTDEDPEIVHTVLSRLADSLGETLGFECSWDISAFMPDSQGGWVITEMVHEVDEVETT